VKDIEIREPIIMNSFGEFEKKVTSDNPEMLPEDTRILIMQAYFAGFARAAFIVTSVEENKDELKVFSKANRDAAKKLGVKHVSMNG